MPVCASCWVWLSENRKDWKCGLVCASSRVAGDSMLLLICINGVNGDAEVRLGSCVNDSGEDWFRRGVSNDKRKCLPVGENFQFCSPMEVAGVNDVGDAKWLLFSPSAWSRGEISCAGKAPTESLFVDSGVRHIFLAGGEFPNLNERISFERSADLRFPDGES